MDELARLAITAGAEILDRFTQPRDTPSATSYFGKGACENLKTVCEALEVDTVITNDSLEPRQRRNLENLIDTKVIDRTELILDIFAQHASSKAGRAQVELAQLEYLLPRLRGWGQALSRQGGGQVGGGAGMGSRGPGETQLEIDRRRITQKISLLKKRIAKIKLERTQNRQNRTASSIPSFAIVGYTNTGKSSLLNLLTDADIIIQDALFATLDTTTRQIKHPKYTITDTVGFIQDLPTSLVEAFRSTLEEATDCDFIIHVVDASAPKFEQQIQTVNDILAQIRGIDVDGKVVLKDVENELLVFNKIDLLTDDELERLERKYPKAIFISVAQKTNIDALHASIRQAILNLSRFKDLNISITYKDYAAFAPKLAKIYEVGEVISRIEGEDGIEIKARVPNEFTL